LVARGGRRWGFEIGDRGKRRRRRRKTKGRER
jgi:hypothetical protein